MRDSKPVHNETHLGRIPLFDELPDGEIQQIAKASKTLLLEKCATLFRTGETCPGLHVVMYGQVKVAFSSTQGSEKVVDILQAGHSFGEAELLLDEPYRAHAQALGDTLVLQIAKTTILDLIARHPGFVHKLLNGMSKRLHDLMVDLEGYTLHTGVARVLTFLLREAAAGEPCNESAVVRLSAPKGVIASRLNLSPEYFSRILHDLSERGYFAIQGRDIHINSVSRLRLGLA